MKGSVLTGIILIAAIAMAAGLWYFTQVAHYQRVSGLTQITINGQSHNVRDYQGIDGVSSPLKLRACFHSDWGNLPKTPPYKDSPTPLIAPGWFGCFDATQIATDLSNGVARALLAEENQPFGFDRYIAYYADGRAYMWRQINRCGKDYFEGRAMPVECPSPDTQTARKRVMIDPDSELFTLKLTSIIGQNLHKMRITGDPKIAAASTGRDFHACLQTPSSLAFLSETFVLAEGAAPPPPRGNFACFDAAQIKSDIAQGRAIALLGQRNIIAGYDRLIAVYPDGTAYAWHQRGTP